MQAPSPEEDARLQQELSIILQSASPVIIKERALWYYLRRLDGVIYRHVKNRQTKAITVNGQSYFVKLHAPLSWKEALKSLLQGRSPMIGAIHEWKAIACCEQTDLLTTPRIAYGAWGYGIWQRSLLITSALTNLCSLEEIGHYWQKNSPSYPIKSQVIRTVANTAHRFHAQGMNHCDFYVCHFLVPQTVLTTTKPLANITIHIIDLHRVQIRKTVPTRWLIKDLSALLFSILDYPITYHDCLLFLRYYYPSQSLKQILLNKSLWQKIIKRALKLYQKENQQSAKTPLALTLQKWIL